MAATGLCVLCRAIDLPGFGQVEPGHCRGTGDMPAPPGVLGGFRCSCTCRGENVTGQPVSEGDEGSSNLSSSAPRPTSSQGR